MPPGGRVSVRELRQNLSVYLRRVMEGEALEVTQRGRPVAVLRPLGHRRSPTLERMIEDGRLRPATASRHDLEPPMKVRMEVSASEVLQEQREDH